MTLIHRFQWKRADIEFSMPEDLLMRIVERPGLWMSEPERACLLGDLHRVADACASDLPLRYGVLSGAKASLDRAYVTLLYERRSRQPIAFCAASLLEIGLDGHYQEALHLGLTMVTPSYRARGLCRVISGPSSALLLLRNRLRPTWITNVTQVPAAVGKVAELFANVFPNPEPRSRRTDIHLAIARELMRHHRATFGVGEDAGFDEGRFIITDAYTGGSASLKKTFAEAPRHRRDAFNEMCRTQLDYDRGDDFLQVGQLTLGVVARQLIGNPWLRAVRTLREALAGLTHGAEGSAPAARTLAP